MTGSGIVVAWGWRGWGESGDSERVSFGDDKNVYNCGAHSVNILKKNNTETCTLNGCIVLSINYILIKLLPKQQQQKRPTTWNPLMTQSEEGAGYTKNPRFCPQGVYHLGGEMGYEEIIIIKYSDCDYR